MARVHHMGFTVRNVEISETGFYAPVLGFLGYQRVTGPAHVSFWRDGENGPTVHLVRAEGIVQPPEHDHCAFAVESRAQVDRLHALLVEHRIDVLSSPAEYPQFGARHYAVFFKDSDGRLFEVLHRPSATPQSAIGQGGAMHA